VRRATDSEAVAWHSGYVSGDHFVETEEGLMVTTPTVIWSAGHGMRGYLPESSPSIHTAWEGARGSIEWELDQRDDFYSQVIDDYWLGWVNTLADDKHWPDDDGDINLLYAFFEKVFNGEFADVHGAQYLAEHDWSNLKGLLELEECKRSLQRTPENEPWSGTVEHNHFWIEVSDRMSNDIPEDLEGEELDEFIQELNENGY
jgi:hypothetical protein